ncbi:MAG: hypothetical protein WBF90_33645 [Rivularia sp. (in: cyanobacteria)]
MAFHEIATADTRSETKASFSRQVTRIGGLLFGHWTGYALLKAGGSYASVDITLPSYQRSLNNKAELKLDNLSAITAIGFQPLGDITLGAATGKLKFASSLDEATATDYTESSAASGGTLSTSEDAYRKLNSPSNWTINSDGERIFKIYATNGGAGASATASTMSVTQDTRILIAVNFFAHAHFPTAEDIPLGLTDIDDNNYVNL